MSLEPDSGLGYRGPFRVSLVLLASMVTAVVWHFHGSAEVAIGSAALVLQLVGMMQKRPL
jgi:hypothetical protein